MNLYRLPLDIEPLEEGGYLGRSPLLPGLNVQGDSIEEVERLAPGTAKVLIEAMRIKGVPLPVQGDRGSCSCLSISERRRVHRDRKPVIICLPQ